MSLRLITAVPLTAAGIAPFGDLLMPHAQAGVESVAGVAINAGTAQRFDLAHLDVAGEGGTACVTIFRTQEGAHRAPYRLTAFERHRHGSQTFVPLGAARCLAVVTSGADAPDESAIRAFIVEPGQGLTLRRSVWHHPLITLDAADVLVIERRAAEVDCEVQPIAGQFAVVIGD
ncbi:ureidoglycolate lyase [Herbaspirillum sp. RTI4]|uniref:ureidoglycolate lyase n=1 Tax=Herbaspirillum sp. RTI4 TaxID=3048640 RepID=UPI002AB4B2DC|nr:ureidoglycolate lyase [Herbaspirillum sp. RTI4]MDY7577209.1 ureidoglycolate lyase [Herbaspirillum sp. RTI4]MEA9980499.1 ureidoglycolate lyase [Herbaspirillum sp. RTI4]